MGLQIFGELLKGLGILAGSSEQESPGIGAFASGAGPIPLEMFEHDGLRPMLLGERYDSLLLVVNGWWERERPSTS
jgi:hypothetical protein